MSWIDTGRIALHYEDEDEGETTLLLIHEMGGSLDSWDYLLPLLTPTFRVLRYDCRGSGLSEKPRTPFTIPDFGVDAIGLLDALQVKGPVILVGCAVGGAVALHLAANFPDRFLKVVALSPSTGISADRWQAVLDRADLLEREGSRAGVDSGLDRRYPASRRRDPDRYVRTRSQRIGEDPVGFASTMRMLADMDIEEDIARVTCPVLVIAGSIDADRPPASLAPLAEKMRNATFCVLEDGHFMAIHSPEPLAREILKFVGDDSDLG
ncbi:alpha/beta hydrolase [Breoghania sp.]|uniref:alpha/beta fold hydrolase n=1 Tax=Breoghania sp. TaxID=2065378 RepID=UPI00261B3547|nr:alpha/beta hydrolase [Breoghania sp.]MDJ0933346.1 alpha/beta hydrolase [Breoghania sp.]